MSKKINVIALFIFFVVTLVTPFITTKGISLVAEQTEERDIFANQVFEEEIHHEDVVEFFVSTYVAPVTYINEISFKPQNVFNDILKPPMS